MIERLFQQSCRGMGLFLAGIQLNGCFRDPSRAEIDPNDVAFSGLDYSFSVDRIDFSPAAMGNGDTGLARLVPHRDIRIDKQGKALGG